MFLKFIFLANLQKLQIRNLNEEIVDLKNLVNRLNIELAEYQSKYPNLQKVHFLNYYIYFDFIQSFFKF